MKPELVHPRVYQITAPFGPTGMIVYLYLIDAPTRTVIDTGVASSPHDSVFPALRALGLAEGDVQLVINTHVHADHAGGNGAMKRAGSRLEMHAIDAAYARDHEKYLDFFTRRPLRLCEAEAVLEEREAMTRQNLGELYGIDAELQDGDKINLGDGIALEVIHTPGHTPGSICLYWEGEGLLFTGDAGNGRSAVAGGFPLYCDAEGYIHSLDRLIEREPGTLLQAHNFQWSRINTPLRHGAEARATLRESRAVAEAIGEAVRAEVELDRQRSFLALAGAVVDRLAYQLPVLRERPHGLPYWAAQAIDANLRALGIDYGGVVA